MVDQKVAVLVPHLQRNIRPAPTPTDVETAGGVTTVSELPLPVNLDLYSGDDFSMQLTLTNPDGTIADLSNATVMSEIRTTAAAPAIAATFTPDITGNVISLTLAGSDTQELVGKFVWDCQITSGSQLVTTLVAGKVTFTQDVTR